MVVTNDATSTGESALVNAGRCSGVSTKTRVFAAAIIGPSAEECQHRKRGLGAIRTRAFG